MRRSRQTLELRLTATSKMATAKTKHPTSSRRKTTDLSTGRKNQKARTRQALVDATQSFIRDGRDFTVADVADAAQVGRTTAYCYFPTKESLYSQALLAFFATPAFADFSEIFRRSDDVFEGVSTVVERSDQSVRDHESLYRAMLRVSMEQKGKGLPRRVAIRQTWFQEALAPLAQRLDERSMRRLTSALSLCSGIEAHLVLRDVCGLPASEARQVKLWAADALLRAAIASLEEGPGDRVRARPGQKRRRGSAD